LKIWKTDRRKQLKADHIKSRKKQPAFFQCIQLYKSPVQPFLQGFYKVICISTKNAFYWLFTAFLRPMVLDTIYSRKQAKIGNLRPFCRILVSVRPKTSEAATDGGTMLF